MGEWIKCSERLPDHEGRYAIVYEYGRHVRKWFIGDFLDGRWCCTVDDITITHWMDIGDLPPPPEEE